MRRRFQRGYLRVGHRKAGPDCWEFLWWDTEFTGKKVRRKAVVGTVQQYPNEETAWWASNGLRVSINEARNRQREQLVCVGDLIDDYTRTELDNDPDENAKSHATKIVYKDFLARWVRPGWGDLNIREVRTSRLPSYSGVANCQRDLRFLLSTGRRSAHFRMASSVGQRDWPHGVRRYSTFGGT